MEKKGWKQIAAGVTVSIVGILGLTSCENKNENQEENKKPLTEQNDYKYKAGQTILNDIGYPTIKPATKAGEPDSILNGVDAKSVRDHVLRMNKFEYSNPTYEVKGKKDPSKVKVGIARQGDDMITETGKPEYKIKFSYDERTPEDSIREAKERIEAQKEFSKHFNYNKNTKREWEKIIQRDDQTEYSSTVENGSSEWTSAEPKNLVIEYGGETYDFETYDFGEPKISQKPNEPEKKEPPKGSISKDALINALLEQKSGGRGGKKS